MSEHFSHRLSHVRFTCVSLQHILIELLHEIILYMHKYAVFASVLLNQRSYLLLLIYYQNVFVYSVYTNVDSQD